LDGTKKTASQRDDRAAKVSSLRRFFQPRSVAVIGASRDSASIGHRLFEGLIQNGFEGSVFPVNPKATTIGSVHGYPSLREVPEPVDLAVIVVPREAVLKVVDECADCGVRSLIIISAGFAEVGVEGRQLQEKLMGKVRRYGLRLIGPNCLGLLNTDPHVRLNASFAPFFPPQGNIAMSSESGALGLALLAAADRLNLGISSFVSVGNRADISSNDLLEYWESDAATEVILLYLESFGNPRRFARIARRVSRRKPIVAVKAGRTQAGQRAAGSHTAALAARDVAVDALFHQTGVVRAETLEELLDLAAFLGSQPIPQGRRVAIVTNAGGPAILCADACQAGGLLITEMSAQMKVRLASILPRAASLTNPVDMIASATPEQYRQVIETILASDEVDALIAIYVSVGISEAEAIAQAIRQGLVAGSGTRRTTIPLLACFMPERASSSAFGTGKGSTPCYAYPEAAARVLSKVSAYGVWRSQPLGTIPEFADVSPARAQAICRKALQERGAGWLTTEETRALLQAFRLPVATGGIGRTAEEAVALARRLGFPVAVKLASHQIVHKTEIGGVLLNLKDEAAVRRAFEAIHERLSKEGNFEAMEGVLVQPMVSGGTECMVGMTLDPLFGPLLAFGLGGIHVEILGDVCLRVTPLTDQDAGEMIRSIRGYRLFEGYRGHPPSDIAAIQEVLLRVSQLVGAIPEIRELDLNPIFALPPGQGCRIVDARVQIGPPENRLARRMIGWAEDPGVSVC
jgi:acetyl coenzyme A synthetase (ADP forming)-like protein